MTSALVIPSVILLFDLSAVLETEPRDWQAFARIGPCWFPQRVYDELRALAQSAIDPAHTFKARAFLQWIEQAKSAQIVTDSLDHPALKPVAGQTLSYRARLALEISRCAHGVAQAHPENLIVLVTNIPMAFQGLQAVPALNLCVLPVKPVLVWSRTDRKPSLVAQQLLALRNTPRSSLRGSTLTVMQPRSRAISSDRAPTQPPSRPPSSPRTTPSSGRRSSSPARSTRPPASRSEEPLSSVRPSAATQLLSGAIALVVLLMVIATVWYVLSPQSLNRWLKDHNLPSVTPLSTLSRE